ncbi:hypothetical protein CLUG_00860 [Clavispora lusitaniae ATCC 42720]|uniref:OTU domain-containing protein n=1 Tax=Clavispora lusitaniae (strain ATCC 42720) TaxID=306902 RepID=C4XY37_CLAL4|nr:uncharacterized protein CLUG_00860 [Clavispora lusitaniae ATCC 42720]EEQ36737.1 hypothetical protein CLUG_00860 [Clavispora lusitaniae ATCC 42720]
MDELIARHKKEQRDLVATITSLKKQASKKTRKAVNSKCTAMQEDLDARQRKEIRELNGEAHEEEENTEITPEQLLATLSVEDQMPASATDNGITSEQTSAPPAKKRNRAKEKLAKRQAQIDAIKAEAREEAANSVDYRAIEQESMTKLLDSQGLTLHEIKPDGHCLFSSIQDQLRLRRNLELSVSELRKAAADYIRAHSDDFVPYLFDEATMQLRDVNSYTEELENTAMWGSDMELLAFSKIYDCPIKVFMAGNAPIVFNEEGAGETLYVAYFKHSYGLGEHYNSCR